MYFQFYFPFFEIKAYFLKDGIKATRQNFKTFPLFWDKEQKYSILINLFASNKKNSPFFSIFIQKSSKAAP